MASLDHWTPVFFLVAGLMGVVHDWMVKRLSSRSRMGDGQNSTVANLVERAAVHRRISFVFLVLGFLWSVQEFIL